MHWKALLLKVEDPKVCNWLIEELGANSLIAKNRLTPKYFHDLQEDPVAEWPLSSRQVLSVSFIRSPFFQFLVSLSWNEQELVQIFIVSFCLIIL